MEDESQLIKNPDALAWLLSMSRYFRGVLSRGLHTSRAHAKGDLVGPSDPLSNLRPVVYGGVPEPLPSATVFYSEAELRGTQHDPHEFSLNFAKIQLDALNHAYWADVRLHYFFISGSNVLN